MVEVRAKHEVRETWGKVINWMVEMMSQGDFRERRRKVIQRAREVGIVGKIKLG